MHNIFTSLQVLRGIGPTWSDLLTKLELKPMERMRSDIEKLVALKAGFNHGRSFCRILRCATL